jgi:hypothetical protein
MIYQQAVEIPWWGALIGCAVSAALGLAGALPWRSAAEAAKTERDVVRETNTRLRDEKLELEKENAVLKARTDLHGLRDEVMKRMDAMTDEFKTHSTQDQTTASQQIAALSAMETSLKVIQEQLKK